MYKHYQTSILMEQIVSVSNVSTLSNKYFDGTDRLC